ncbi:type 2 isopentenyl-diphosphate Delta-isomerase [Pseudoclavibacter chungangensis]|uniref:Isopentenyl-diphosphate delta-isomerase n=1 Tax=Pseudoclavibacter chungangensis TaxID=587635 RepID=A0A7J5BV07_9MICO|nr:type 2 isopentenyl-diphosphate Delta-isomerase [Pseudoclavibacter chungangensis]KAB1657954.1 type 2 isopentenyl-diphosphate Delta-isomerase [Pseudoclavibacter chungangensis]NYJ65892.1 isopentenyl-diphosphate delta-isomerase [Pseudoclavibacter chungangensis]
MGTERAGNHESRKDEHLALAAEQAREGAPRNDFDELAFVHHALDGGDADDVRLDVRLGELRWPAPLYINGMTGGTATTARVNRQLAIAARETGLPVASGSMSIALDHPQTAHGFRVLREENPDGFVMANLGAGRSPDDALRAVELVDADALQIHVNAVQETVMPEGDRDFSGWARSIERIVAVVPVPVIVKEVGFGLSGRTQRTLTELGVRIADVSGRGGTDFVRIENDRRPLRDYASLVGFGQSAVQSLLDAPAESPLVLLASGGVRSPLDVAKALALGARAVGVAGGFLTAATEGGAPELVPLIERWLEQLRQLCALLGADSPEDLARTDLLVRGRLREDCELLGIDPAAYARRRDARPRTIHEPSGRTR